MRLKKCSLNNNWNYQNVAWNWLKISKIAILTIFVALKLDLSFFLFARLKCSKLEMIGKVLLYIVFTKKLNTTAHWVAINLLIVAVAVISFHLTANWRLDWPSGTGYCYICVIVTANGATFCRFTFLKKTIAQWVPM